MCGNVIEIQKTRKRSKLETPHRNTETLVSTTPMPGNVIRYPSLYTTNYHAIIIVRIQITTTSIFIHQCVTYAFYFVNNMKKI